MKKRLSLKYRIAVVIFCLEGIMMALVLGLTLSSSLSESRRLLTVNENVLIDLLGDLSRIALFTGEYDDLQPYIEQVVADPHITQILVVNTRDRVVASSNVEDIGSLPPELVNDKHQFWRTKSIDNAAGHLGTIAINFSHEQLLKANRKALDLGITIALAGMFTIAVVGVIIGFVLTRRLDTLSAAATRLANGDLSVSTNLRGNDEIAMMGQTFDQMARSIKHMIADLHTSQEELRCAHNDLEQKVEERTAELAVARDQAMEASRAKGEFIANMSHELRTPLNAIIGYSEMLMEDVSLVGGDELVSDLKRIRGAGEHLLGLINDILDLSKIEAGKMELFPDQFDIAEMVDEVVSTVRPLVEGNGNMFAIDCPRELGYMYADATRIRQCLINLLGNAAKFTEDGRVGLGVKIVSRNNIEWVEFSVQDTGSGISAEDLRKLFVEFSQVDGSSTRRHGGTGLGLAISRRFCRMMGGDIKVTSNRGKGSTFTLVIPRHTPEQMKPIQPEPTHSHASRSS